MSDNCKNCYIYITQPIRTRRAQHTVNILAKLSIFEFRVFPSRPVVIPWLKKSVCPTIYQLLEGK